MVRLDEEDVPGNPGAPLDTEAEARALALEGLLSPLSAPPDLGPMASQGQAAQSLGDAARAQGMPETWAGRDATAGLGDRDIIAPRAGGSATMPDVPAYDPRRDHASASIARPAPAAAPATPTSAPMPTPGPAAPPIAPTSPETGQPVTQAKAATQRGESALDREMRAAQEARARRMIGNAFGTVVEMAGSLATGVPIQPGQATPAGPAEDEARIAREHRLAAAQKDREGREAALETARAEREATLEDREFDLRSRALDIQAARAGQPQTPRDLDVARAEQIRNAIADREARRDASSEQSRAAQAAFRGLINTLPPRMRQGLGASFDDATLATMSADALAPSISRLSRVTERIGAGSGGGGGGSHANVAAMRQRYVALGGTQEAADAMNARQLAAELNIRTRDGEGTPTDNLFEGIRSRIPLEPGEARATRERMLTYRDGYRALVDIERLIRARGPSAVVDPALQSEIEPSLVTLRSMVATIQGTGIINPGERPLIDATLPDPSSISGWTLGRIDGALRGWRSRLEGAASSLLESRTVDRDGIQAGLRFLRTGSSASPSQPSRTTPGTATTPATDVPRVPMINPEGQRMMVRADQRDAAIGRGWRAAQ